MMNVSQNAVWPRASICASMLLAFLSPGCKSHQVAELRESTPAPQEDLRECVALRGNGDFITSHFGGLARFHEDIGVPDAMAGGSSASVTMFLYESLRLNPDVSKSLRQSDDIGRRKLSLLLKSFQGYVDFLKASPRRAVFDHFQELRSAVSESGLQALPHNEWSQAKDILISILSKERFVSLINTDLLLELRRGGTYGFKDQKTFVHEVVKATKMLGHFEATESAIFFRPSLINFNAFAENLSLIADFYAGSHVESRSKLQDFMERCSNLESEDKLQKKRVTWQEIAAFKPTNSQETCQDLFLAAVTSFEAAILENKLPATSRLDQVIGLAVPSFVSTAVIQGAAGIEQFNAAKVRYQNGLEPSLSLNVPRDLRFGYWILERFRTVTEGRYRHPSDKKGEFFHLISSHDTWRQALVSSPAEPSLAPAVPLNKSLLSIGGWSDLHPVQILKNAGCDRVTYMTRRGPETPFILGSETVEGKPKNLGLAALLGFSSQESSELFDINNPKSGYYQAIKEADRVLCSDWSQMKSGMFAEIMNEAYQAEILNRGTEKRIIGCTP